MKTQKSIENYLETIYLLSQNGKPVRAVDIANFLKFSKPTVSVALKRLKNLNYIYLDENKHITLTKTGEEIALSMSNRHIILSDWLIMLGVDKDIAVADACKIEHEISEDSFLAIKRHIESAVASDVSINRPPTPNKKCEW